MKHVTTIYIYLLDEGTDVWRPVEAEHLSDDLYRIISINSDPEGEKWQFSTGDTVRCKMQQLANGKSTNHCLVATELISNKG